MAEVRVPWTDDEVIVAADLARRRSWHDLRGSDPEVIALSDLLRSLPWNREHAEDERFRSANSVSRKIGDIVSVHPDYPGQPTRGGKTTASVVEAFVAEPDMWASIADTIRQQWAQAITGGADPYDAGDVDPVDNDAGAAEGRLIRVAHFRRERDPKLRQQKIASLLRQGAALACEVCGFDFGRMYGDIGDGYIEVHHIVPLHASGETTTRLADLAVVCSNCHRMIHRRTPWLTPQELRDHVQRTG